MPPSISVIIPVYNAAPYLAEALRSVLAQTRSANEIIVVDDGSTDDSAAVAQGFVPQVKLIQQANLGAAAARNSGVRLAQGDLLAFLDADDLWFPDKLALQWEALHGEPYPQMVFGMVEQFRSPDAPSDIRFAGDGQVMAGLHVGAMLIQTEAFHQVGLFRTDLSVGEFIDWYSRASGQGLRSLTLPQIVMRRRLHQNNMMRHAQNVPGDYLNILRDGLRRRRKQESP
jgi:glycosyltransferase involved in cell wall biosynthesis